MLTEKTRTSLRNIASKQDILCLSLYSTVAIDSVSEPCVFDQTA